MDEKSGILARLKELLQDRFDANPDQVTRETTVRELGIDSILMVDLMLDIETEMDFTFSTMDLPKSPTVGDIVDLIYTSKYQA